MRCRPLALVALVAVASSGCLVLSLQPAYDAGSVVFDEALLGTWENAEDGSRATIERGEWRSYKVTYVDHFTTRIFQGNLTKIGDGTLLDLTELRGVDPGPFLVPVHGVLRVDIHGDEVSAAMLDYTWFMHAMTQKTIVRLAPAVDDRRNVMITVPSEELRRWLPRAPDGAFGAPMSFKRKP